MIQLTPNITSKTHLPTFFLFYLFTCYEHLLILHIFCFFLVISKLSLIDTNFEPDSSRMNLKKFVSCTPGFGIREVFCAACPPHHYSPDKSIECLKCVKGFHQPVAGSEKCIKCRNIFSSGCYVVSTRF